MRNDNKLISNYSPISIAPSSVVNLIVYSKSPSNLTVAWEPPDPPNGIITHYLVKWQKQNMDKEQFNERDFCRESRCWCI